MRNTDEEMKIDTTLDGDISSDESVGEPSAPMSLDITEDTPPGVAIMQRVKPSTLKIMVTSKAYDHEQPWSAPTIQSCSGSGFVITLADEKKYIVTNAHVEEGSVRITVKPADGKKDYSTEPVLVDHRCDLALLELPDALQHLPALEIDSCIPRLGEKVHVVGFPQLGEKVCITSGGISRCELDEYAQSEWNGLQYGVDAAINPGNSGGPAVNSESRLVGVAFQGADNNQGFIIPCEVLMHFLQDYLQNGVDNYGGFPSLSLKTQLMPSKVIRRSKGLPKQESGVLVAKVPQLSSAYGLLQAGDIITHVNGHSVSNEGEVKVRDSFIDWDYLVSSRHIGETISVRVFRNKEMVDCEVPLRHTEDHCRMILHEQVKPPEYIINSGVVFKVLTENDGGIMEDDGVVQGSSEKSIATDQIVFAQDVLDSRYTKGFSALVPAVIVGINKQRVRNIQDVIKSLGSSDAQYNTIQLKSGEEIVIENVKTERGMRHHLAMLKQYGVLKVCSDNLLEKARAAGIIQSETQASSASASAASLDLVAPTEISVPPSHQSIFGGAGASANTMTPGQQMFAAALGDIEMRARADASAASSSSMPQTGRSFLDINFGSDSDDEDFQSKESLDSESGSSSGEDADADNKAEEGLYQSTEIEQRSESDSEKRQGSLLFSSDHKRQKQNTEETEEEMQTQSFGSK